MRTIALVAAAAALFACPAFALQVTSTVAAIDTKHNAVTLGDGTVMVIAKDIDLSPIKPGMRVTITTYMDDNGMQPAKSLLPVQ